VINEGSLLNGTHELRLFEEALAVAVPHRFTGGIGEKEYASVYAFGLVEGAVAQITIADAPFRADGPIASTAIDELARIVEDAEPRGRGGPDRVGPQGPERRANRVRAVGGEAECRALLRCGALRRGDSAGCRPRNLAREALQHGLRLGDRGDQRYCSTRSREDMDGF